MFDERIFYSRLETRIRRSWLHDIYCRLDLMIGREGKENAARGHCRSSESQTIRYSTRQRVKSNKHEVKLNSEAMNQRAANARPFLEIVF